MDIAISVKFSSPGLGHCSLGFQVLQVCAWEQSAKWNLLIFPRDRPTLGWLVSYRFQGFLAKMHEAAPLSRGVILGKYHRCISWKPELGDLEQTKLSGLYATTATMPFFCDPDYCMDLSGKPRNQPTSRCICRTLNKVLPKKALDRSVCRAFSTRCRKLYTASWKLPAQTRRRGIPTSSGNCREQKNHRENGGNLPKSSDFPSGFWVFIGVAIEVPILSSSASLLSSSGPHSNRLLVLWYVGEGMNMFWIWGIWWYYGQLWDDIMGWYCEAGWYCTCWYQAPLKYVSEVAISLNCQIISRWMLEMSGKALGATSMTIHVTLGAYFGQ